MHRTATITTALLLLLAACGQPSALGDAATPTSSAIPAATQAVTQAALLPPPATATLGPYPNGTPTRWPTDTPYPYPIFITPTPYPSATTGPSPTPPPTWTDTATPTATATAIVVPPVQTVTANDLPTLARDVLFLDRGRLMLWHKQSGQIETLLEPPLATEGLSAGAVKQFVVSAASRTIAIERAGEVSTTFEIDLFNLDTRQILPVHVSTLAERGLLALALSPDGEWLAYITKAALAPGVEDYGVYTGTVFMVRTDTPDQPREVGACFKVESIEYSRGCLRAGALVWSPDSSTLAWNDGAGVWLAEPEQTPRLLIAHKVPDTVQPKLARFAPWTSPPTGGSDDAFYFPWTWSAAGDYLLTYVGHYEGAHYAVISVATGLSIEIPNSDEYPWPVVRATWMADGRLFVVRQTQDADSIHFSMSGEIWRLDTDTAAFVLDQLFPIVTAAEGELAQLGPSFLVNGQLAWGITNEIGTDYQTRGLFTYTLGDAAVRKVNGLPVTRDWWSAVITWAPDGSGALVHFPYTPSLLYAPADGSALYDLTPALGEGVCCFAWLG